MRSLQFGAYGNMLDNIVGTYIGYVQIHGSGFWEEKTLDNSFSQDDIGYLKDLEEVTHISPRIESFALASFGSESKPVAVLGLDAQKEQQQIGLANKVVEGNYLNGDGVLVAIGLRDVLQLKISDTLVFLSQGYQGSMASGAYPIAGFIDLSTPELNKRTVIMNLDKAQEFYGMPNLVTTAVIGVDGNNWERDYESVLVQTDTNTLEVMQWQQMLPELKQLITVDRAGGTFILIILYSIIAFSLFGTVLMLTEERSFEYGVLISIGMAKTKVVQVAVFETLILTVVGVIAGLIVAFPFVLYFNINPINLSGQMQEVVERFGFEALIPTSLDPSIAITHSGIIFLLALVVNLYAVFKIKSLNPVKAMRK